MRTLLKEKMMKKRRDEKQSSALISLLSLFIEIYGNKSWAGKRNLFGFHRRRHILNDEICDRNKFE